MSDSAPPLSDDAWRTAIGPRADRYLPVFRDIEARGGGWVAGWNWAVFASSTPWFFYRRMTRLAIANLLLIPIVALFAPTTMLAILPDSATRIIPWGTVSTYLLLAFVAMPVYADSLYYSHLKRELARPASASAKSATPIPSLGSAIRGVLLGACLPAGVIAIAITAYSERNARIKVSEAIVKAHATRNAINEFHALQKRLPTQAEAAGLPDPPASSEVQSVKWEAARQRVVVTLPDPLAGGVGGRVALQANLRDGALTWTCINVDAPRKFVPASCRN